jgi:energy-coupling factor transporter transmembrane protein EcfT
LKILKLIGYIVLITVLTILSQTGGLIFLLCIPLFRFVSNKIPSKTKANTIKVSSFLFVYLLVTFTVTPLIARSFGRVALPILNNDNLKPLNIGTCILNRHYVRPELKKNLIDVSKKMHQQYPNTVVSYLDANFPFYNGFPLLPHLSHNDGKKVDIAFFYKDKNDNLINNAPSFIGYGVYEVPKNGEYNMPENCKSKGYWQYSIIEKFIPQWNKDKMIFDKDKTKQLIQLLIEKGSTSKIFVEPHLKSRMNIKSNKVRFHGCRAVRHDDHIHLQIK